MLSNHKDMMIKQGMVTLFVMMLCLVMVVRLCHLTLWNHTFLNQKEIQHTEHMSVLPAHRGMLLDRHGAKLALSMPVWKLWVNPFQIHAQHISMRSFCHVFSDSRKCMSFIKKHANKHRVRMPMTLNAKQKDSIAHMRALQPYVSLEKHYKRYYPYGASFAQVLGRSNIDDQGIDGLELKLNHWLEGHQGKALIQRDALGRTLLSERLIKQAIPGKSVALSLDRSLQQVSFEALKSAVQHAHAQSGSAIIVDVHSGEVLSAVNYPSYNPNKPVRSYDVMRNRIFTDQFEPGSTIKPLIMSLALMNHRVNLHDRIPTHGGVWNLGKYTIRDEFKSDSLSLEDIIMRSSNIGMAQISLSMSSRDLLDGLSSLGLGTKTMGMFPGEVTGYLPKELKERQFVEKATMGFGYGLSMSLAQLARAYTILADGRIKQLTFLKEKGAKPGNYVKVMSDEVVQIIRRMLGRVVSARGTGHLAVTQGARLGGKTGTVKQVSHGSYEGKRYLSSFVGMAPVDKPKVVIAVMLREPDYAYRYGGISAAPLFKKLATLTLQMWREVKNA